MVRTIMRLASERPELAFVSDQIGHHVHRGSGTDDPAHRRDRRSGVYHVTNQTPTSWYGFARDVVAAMGKNPDMVRAITTAELQPARPAAHSANSVRQRRSTTGRHPAAARLRRPARETVKALL
jgi:dTDP-4-dehydrorhamnose reductase